MTRRAVLRDAAHLIFRLLAPGHSLIVAIVQHTSRVESTNLGAPPLRKIEAIIRPFKIDAVREALGELGVPGMTVTEVRGFGRSGGRTEVFHGVEYVVSFVPKVKVEIVVPDHLVEAIVEQILREAVRSR